MDALSSGATLKNQNDFCHYRHGSAEVEPSEMEEGQARTRKSANTSLKLATAVDVPSQPIANLTSPNNSPSLPKALRVTNITGISLGSNKANR
jgi:hypothetical protein